MTYDFSRFSAQSFERFVQAMAVAVAGPTVQIFGAGRDGGREATFEGETTLSGATWSGYFIFQAKHKQYPVGPAEDADWLIEQIDKELAKFANPKRSLRRPDYYVLASNVRLSAAAANSEGRGEGGIDKVTRHLRNAASALGITDVLLWHADTLSSLLDNYESVRRQFTFWVQPGDVLAKLLGDLEGPAPGEILLPFLRRSLRQAREIKTRDIGQAVGRTVALDEVFIDLPIDQQGHGYTWVDVNRADTINSNEPLEDLDGNVEEFLIEGRYVAAELMRLAAQKFEPQAFATENSNSRNGLSNRIVVMGGPGQGKSTIGQFLAQLCRARLLDTLKIYQIPETNQAIEAVLECARAEHIPLFGPPRYPFHIELPRYADALSVAERSGAGLSILAHVADDITKGADHAITPLDLKRWLATIPAVLILDGLDEVPRSGNRAEVVKAIEDLLETVHEANSDCLILCTSRPQGYQQELSPKLWSHWNLEPLSGSTALRLASRVSAVLVSEETRREEILSTLNEAAEDKTTASLMTSPLQVMLLFQLVATHDNIPKDRWTLFNRHYETLRDREIAKGGTTGNTIRLFRAQIDSIHQDAGFLLHLRAEGAGGADAYFTDSEFEQLVAAQLERDGFEAEDMARASEIANLATNRLVFLRSQTDGKVAFDVRSLQEFMAAARLTTSPEVLIRERLEEISGRAHWLHVFKIACSKIFASRAHEALRTPVIGLLDSLDEGDRYPDNRLLKTGSKLALQLLTDGTALSVPVYRRQLVVRALRRLALPDLSDFWNLTSVLRFEERTFLEPLLTEMLNRGDPHLRLMTLRLLAYASRYSSPTAREWSRELLLGQLPEKPAEILSIFNTLPLLPEDPNICIHLRNAQWQLSPGEVVKWLEDFFIDEAHGEGAIPAKALICGAFPTLASARLEGNSGRSDLVLKYRSMNSALTIFFDPEPGAHPIWLTMVAASAFADDPSVDHACTFLEAAVGVDLKIARTEYYPWPLHGLLLEHTKHDGNHQKTIASVRAGELGNPITWRAAEIRWDAEGIRASDIIARHRDAMALDWTESGAPSIVGNAIARTGESAANAVLSLIKLHPERAFPNALAFRYLAGSQHGRDPRLINFLKDFDRAKITVGYLPWQAYGNALTAAIRDSFDDSLFAQLIDAVPNIPRLSNITQDLIEQAASKFNENTSKRHLLIIITAGIRSNSRNQAPKLNEIAFEMVEGDSLDIKASVAILQIMASSNTAINAEALKALTSFPTILFPILKDLAQGKRGTRGVDIASSICREVLTGHVLRVVARCHEQLAALAEARPVDLSNRDRADALELPHALAPRGFEGRGGTP